MDKKAGLHNFADDNTITCTGDTPEISIKDLENESHNAVLWFKETKMIVNPEKFQSIIVKNKMETANLNVPLKVDGKLIYPEPSVKLLGLNIDNKLSFDEHISSLCKRSAGQLNALCRINKFLGLVERKAIVNSFIFANFNYCPLVWHFCSKTAMRKIENIQKRALRFIFNDYSSSYEQLLGRSKTCTI